MSSLEALKPLLLEYAPPKWASHLACLPSSRIAKALLPTPLQDYTSFAPHRFQKLLIKRDDLSEMTMTGNKVRKLEFLLADAIQQNCDSVITIGCSQSNHARTTAVFARQVGLEPHLLLRCKSKQEDPGLCGNLLLDRLIGAKLHLVEMADYKKHGQYNLVEALADQLRKEGRRPYLIPAGGSNTLGTWGYIECVNEIATQLEEQQLKVDDIVCACGSGSTASGIAIGVYLRNLLNSEGKRVKVHAITVCDNAKYFFDHIQSTIDDLKIDPTGNLKAQDIINIIDDYRGLGYALSTDEELQTIITVARATTLIFDPIYSGKAFHGLLNHDAFKNRSVLFVHTGGLFGLYDSEKLSQLSPLFERSEVAAFTI